MLANENLESTMTKVMREVSDRINPVRDAMTEYQVSIVSVPALGELVDELIMHLNVRVPNGVVIPSREDLLLAFDALITMRVAYVRGVRNEVIHPKDVVYPAFLFPIVTAIGDVVDMDQGFALRVTREGIFDQRGYLKPQVLDQFKKALQVFDQLYAIGATSHVALEFAYGLPKSKSGIIDFFAFQTSGDRLKSDVNDRDPVSAMLRSAFEIAAFEWIWARAHWDYGSISELRRTMRAIVRSTIRGG